MARNKTKITNARACAFAPPPGREAVLWDCAVPGLGLRTRPSGHKTWIMHRRLGRGVVKRTLAAADAMTVEDARRAARAVLDEAGTGDTVAPVAPTMRTFGPVFLADCAGRWKPATRAAHADNMRRAILPAFGNRPVDAITARDVRNWFDDLSATRTGLANRALAVLSSLMKHAEVLGLRPEGSNPCRGLRRRKIGFEARYLSGDEFAALGRALDGAEGDHPFAAAALLFLLYTGARKSEALRLRWEHVHGARAVLPDSKTGPRTIWLAAPARAVLAAQHRHDDCPWVFASTSGDPVSVDKAWKMIRAEAGLDGLRIHDLCHSHASHAIMKGESLHVTGRLLGHRRATTTNRYTHLDDPTLSEAAERVAGAIERKLGAADKVMDHSATRKRIFPIGHRCSKMVTEELF